MDRARAMHYSPPADILYVYADKLEPGITIEAPRGFAFRVSYDQTRLLAVEVHNFEALFLKCAPELERAWKIERNPVLRRLSHVRVRTRKFLLDHIGDSAASSVPDSWRRMAHA